MYVARIIGFSYCFLLTVFVLDYPSFGLCNNILKLINCAFYLTDSLLSQSDLLLDYPQNALVWLIRRGNT